MPSPIKTTFQRHWFLFGLVGVMLAGYFAAGPLSWMTDAATLRRLLVAFVIFLTTLPVQTAVIGQTLRRPLAPVIATVINFGFLPLFAWALSPLLSGDLSLGFLVTAAAPCTVASAAVWTRRAGGNDVVAIMVTIITNVSCFVVTALWLGLMTGDSVELPMAPADMIGKLALIVFLPIVCAQALRQHPAVARFANDNRKRLSIVAQVGLLMIVLFGAVHCGMKLREIDWAKDRLVLQCVVMLAMCVVLHSVSLFVGQFIGRRCGLERADWIAVGFAGSQKTLAVGLQVGLMVGGGMVIVPMVAYHFLQLFIDTVVANRLADYDSSH